MGTLLRSLVEQGGAAPHPPEPALLRRSESGSAASLVLLALTSVLPTVLAVGPVGGLLRHTPPTPPAPLRPSESGFAPLLFPVGEIHVRAGSRDRRDTVVSFALSVPKAGASYLLRDAQGSAIPLQLDEGGQAWFVLPELKAGASKTYRIEVREGSTAAPGVVATTEADAVRIAWEGRDVLRYQGGKGVLPSDDIKPILRRGGYIHPVFTPRGRVVTEDYPKDHRHHHGIWFAWTKTEFHGRTPDFWNMGDGKATVEFESLHGVWSGAVHAGLRARHRYVDLSAEAPTTVLKETWETRVYAVGHGSRPYALFDVEVAQVAATASPLVLPEYHYGGIGFRGAGQWLGAENAFFLTSEGKDRANGHGTRARWAHVSGRVDGELAGVAILGHPSNYRAPEPMRIHPTEPFFCYAPSQLGRWEIAEGTPHVARYRFVVQDGPPEPNELDRLWNDYADPPQVLAK